MFSIKNSFANCLVCELLHAPSCILETNCEDDITKVDIIFIAENPGKEEVKTGRPLIGKAGQTFRKYFEKFGLDKLNYLLTNVVLCQTINPDGTTGNPSEEVIERCSVNCKKIIEICDPKLVVLMGSSSMSAFDLGKSGITKMRGKVYNWKNYKIFLTLHPSFINRQPAYENVFVEDLMQISKIMGLSNIEASKENIGEIIGKGIFRYKIPDKFYTKNYRLIDIQYLSKSNKVLYIFRDKNNKKVYHKEDSSYVCYQIPIENKENSRKIMPYEQLNQIKVNYKEKYNLDPEITYEGDIRITAKHAMDYYYYNVGDCEKKENNILYLDIEVDTGDKLIFPKPELAEFPISLISTRYNGKNVTYVLDNKTEPIRPIKGIDIKTSDKEEDLLQQFLQDLREIDPDFIAGWNSISFDLNYIYHRLEKLGLNKDNLSRFGEVFIDGEKYIANIPGVIAVDQYFLYRRFTFTKLESYKLGYVASLELGETKRQLDLPINEMYWKQLNRTIEYNIQDTILLEKLEDKLGHINLLTEIAKVCNTSLEAGSSSFGQIDSLMISFLRNQGLASKNADPNISKEKYPGAFVFEPIPGIYNWICDFDFSSLYPSLIITYNIGVESFVMKLKDEKLAYDLIYQKDQLPQELDVIIDPLNQRLEMRITKDQLFKKIEQSNLVYTINGCFFLPHKKKFSEFAQVVESLMQSRKEYKSKMLEAIEKKDKNLENFYNTRQLVYKVLANSLYGIIANKVFRFFDTSLASAITMSGQEALKTCIIEADAFLRSLKDNIDYKPPKPLSKDEMYADPDVNPEIYFFPDRSREFIITGDTDSIFCCFEKIAKQKTLEEIQKYCIAVEEFLNKNKILELIKKHNVDPEFNRLQLKNELLISRGLFLAKKRYAIRVVGQEGKSVDKINFMGVEVKRSDFPSYSKDFLKELLDLILKSEKVSIPKLMQFIKQKEREFHDLISNGDKRVARPVSYTKEEADYKTIPQGVKAMENWNKIMYEIHRAGNKAYMFWVKGIDQDKAPPDVFRRYQQFLKDGNKLDVIAIPDEENRLPPFFVVDIKTAMKFAFKDRYTLILQPILDLNKNEDLLKI